MARTTQGRESPGEAADSRRREAPGIAQDHAGTAEAAVASLAQTAEKKQEARLQAASTLFTRAKQRRVEAGVGVSAVPCGSCYDGMFKLEQKDKQKLNSLQNYASKKYNDLEYDLNEKFSSYPG